MNFSNTFPMSGFPSFLSLSGCIRHSPLDAMQFLAAQQRLAFLSQLLSIWTLYFLALNLIWSSLGKHSQYSKWVKPKICIWNDLPAFDRSSFNPVKLTDCVFFVPSRYFWFCLLFLSNPSLARFLYPTFVQGGDKLLNFISFNCQRLPSIAHHLIQSEICSKPKLKGSLFKCTQIKIEQ